VLVEDELRITDSGLVPLIWQPGGWSAHHLNARYAAPELLAGHTSPACDQYSLALVYLEMLVGVHPHQGLTRRQLAESKWRGKLSLTAVSAADAAILARALDADPAARFPSCTALIRALQRAEAAEHSSDVGGARVPESSA